jgi:pyruvate formate lyase activating enzyme
MVDIAEKSKAKELKNVMVTNGFVNAAPLDELFDYIDAFNVDLKAFTEPFYKGLTMSKLAPVKETLKSIRKKGKHLEITNLVVTGQNDQKKDFEEMVKWIAGELGKETVFHISRYFPTYKMSEPPTPANVMDDLYNLAKEHLAYVYLGNLATNNGQNTYCAGCGKKVIDRSRYDTWVSGLDNKGFCKNCGNKVLEYI